MSKNNIESDGSLLYAAGREEGFRDGVRLAKAVMCLYADGREICDIADELSIDEEVVYKILEND